MAAPVQVEHNRVAWIDTDAGGRIHFTCVFRWAEAAETSLFRRFDLFEHWGAFPRRHVEAEYLAVLVFEDAVEVRLWPDKVGTTSITFAWEILRGEELCVRGRPSSPTSTAVCRPAPLPDGIRQALSGG